MAEYVRVVSIPVTDQERAREFYVDKLGFELRSPPGVEWAPGQKWIQVAPPGAQTALTLVTWYESMQPGSIQGLVLATDDLDRRHQELLARGVQFSGDKTQAPWGRHIQFVDPDGNGWVLLEPARYG